MNKSASILFVFLVLAIVFGLYQTFRLKKVSTNDATLKYQFMNTQNTQDKIHQDLQEAYKTIDILKHENERISKLLEEKRLEENKRLEQGELAEEGKQSETDKQSTEELKKRVEKTLGAVPE